MAEVPAADGSLASRRARMANAVINREWMDVSSAGGLHKEGMVEVDPAAAAREVLEIESAETVATPKQKSIVESGLDMLGAAMNTRAPLSPRGAPKGLMAAKLDPKEQAIENFKNVLFGTKLNILLGFIPFAMFAHTFELGDGPTFTLSLLALCPLAERLGYVTEEMAKHTNSTIGGLLNATFGNATEMIVSVFALRDGLLRVVQLSLLGSILSNMLLVLGCAFFAGGVHFPSQKFNATGVMTNAALLCLAVGGMSLPAALHATHTELAGTVSELSLSRFSACLLLLMYILFLYFQLVSHKEYFEEEEDDDDDDEEAELGFTESIYYMAGITVLISLLSDYIVDTIEGAAASWSCPVAFISVIILPIVGNAAEHASAVMFAMKDKMDISMGVAIGSSTQIALFVIPFCILVAWAMDKPLDLNLHIFETMSLVLTVITVTFVIADGRANWLKGLILTFTYLILSASYYCHAEPPQKGLSGTSKILIN